MTDKEEFDYSQIWGSPEDFARYYELLRAMKNKKEPLPEDNGEGEG
jgi:hypothetical protein